jgi:alanine dehydrogenase
MWAPCSLLYIQGAPAGDRTGQHGLSRRAPASGRARPGGIGEAHSMKPIYIDYLNRLDIEELQLSDGEILAAIEASLAAQGRGETVIEPRVHLEPGVARGHFNVLRGAIKAPIDAAGVKVVGDFVDNYLQGLPSELAILLLLDPSNGVPKAFLDASGITDMRTGAVTAIGAKYLARKDARILGHVGARGTAYWNVRLLNHLFDFAEIRVHSRRPESRKAFAERLAQDLGKPVIATEDWESCVTGADIVVEASRLPAPEPMLKTTWIKPGALVVPYGTMSAVELTLTDIMAKLVVDDWGQCKAGKFGSLRAHVEAGKLSEATLHAELGQIVAGLKPGRESEAETNLLWHRGLSLSDIALGHAMLAKAAALGIGQRLRFA